MKIESLLANTLTILGATMLLVNTGHAGGVAVNFSGHLTAGLLKPSDKAGLSSVAQTNWNNATNADGSLEKLKDSAGVATDIHIEWKSHLGSWDSGRINENSDATMMGAYLDAGPKGEHATVTFKGISYAPYDVIIYFDGGNNDGRVAAYTVDGVTLYGKDEASFSGEYLECGELDAKEAKAGNYVRFRNMVAPTFTVKAVGVAGPNEYVRAPINGIQLVEIPAP